ncbi:uncharacterized protein LOC105702301 isoform X2 [Orussus abietinus]|nr:uncharacterized protein LOC105702301 isoform X2 [Orussus abietinus]
MALNPRGFLLLLTTIWTTTALVTATSPQETSPSRKVDISDTSNSIRPPRSLTIPNAALNSVPGGVDRKVTHQLVGGHLRITEESRVPEDLVASSAGSGRERKPPKTEGDDEDEKKTLSQQVKEGKYGLIQNEIHRDRPERPGIISYLGNPEVPRDTARTLGGLDEEEIWLAENHVLVLRGGRFPERESSQGGAQEWGPIDDYEAPRRPVKIPKRPQVPPPFPVQLEEGGPVRVLGKNGSETRNDTLEGVTSPPRKGFLPGQGPFFADVGGPSPGRVEGTPATGKNTTRPPLGVPGPFFPALPPGAVFVPPPGNHSDHEDEDQSLYYPPPYSFRYEQGNSTEVPPGPLVPGIILPPPPDFFLGEEEEDDTAKKTPKDSPVQPGTERAPPRFRKTKPHKSYSIPVTTTSGPTLRTRFRSKGVGKTKLKNATGSPWKTGATRYDTTGSERPEVSTAGYEVKHQEMGPELKHVGVASEVKHLGVDSEVKHLGVRPEVKHLGIRSEVKHVRVRPEVKHLGVRPEVKHLGVRPEVKQLGVDSEVKHLGVETEVKHLGVEPEVKPLRVQSEVKHLRPDSDTEHRVEEKTPWTPGRRFSPLVVYYPSTPSSVDQTVEATPAPLETVVTGRPNHASYYFYGDSSDNGPLSEGPVTFSTTTEAPVFGVLERPAEDRPKPQQSYDVETLPSRQTSRDRGLVNSINFVEESRALNEPQVVPRTESNPAHLFLHVVTPGPSSLRNLLSSSKPRTYLGSTREEGYNLAPSTGPKPIYQFSYEAANYPQQSRKPIPEPQSEPEPVSYEYQEIRDEVNRYEDYGVEEVPREQPQQRRLPQSGQIPSELTYPEVEATTPNPRHAFYTEQDDQLLDDVTREYFTIFGKRLGGGKAPTGTTPLYPEGVNAITDRPPIKSMHLRPGPGIGPGRGPQVKVHYGDQTQRPFSLHGDTLVNYRHPLPPINPDSEPVPIVQGHGGPSSRIRAQEFEDRAQRFEKQGHRNLGPDYAVQRVVQEVPVAPVAPTASSLGLLGPYNRRGQPDRGVDLYPPSPVVSLEGDIAVNYRRPRPPIDPDAELIGPVRDRASSYFAYRLPGDGGHFYFLTPHTVAQRQERAGYLYPRPRGPRRARRLRTPARA